MSKIFMEEARSIEVFDECDILVVGGGAAGHSAAIAAARAGAKNIVLLERYGYMGGDVTGGYVIMVPNLDHLKKGGRITPAVALLAGMLKIVPVMELNYKLGGKIDTLTKVRTVKKAAKSLIDRAIEKGADASTYAFAIEHVLCEKEANDLKDYLISQIGECDVVVRELPAVVGAHMGVGGIGVQYIKVKK